MKKLNKDQLTNIAYGACLMGSGGGGPLSTALKLINNFKSKISVDLYEYARKNDLKDNDLTAVIAIMGAPEAMLNLNSIDSATSSFSHLNKIKSNKIKYLVPGEIGPTSMIVPLLLASQENLGIIDADGIGRAVPSLTQCLFADQKVSTNPTVIANDKKQNLIMPVNTPEEVESIGRGVLTSDAFNQQGALSTWVMDKNTIPSNLISGSVSLCNDIGKILNPLKNGFDIDNFINKLNGLLANRKAAQTFTGKLIDRSETTEGGFDFGSLHFENEEKEVCTIFNQNENLIAWNSKKESPMVIAPDSICYVSFTGMPYTNADFKEEDNNKEFYIIKIEACKAVKTSDSISESFRKALLNLGYGGKMLY